MSEEIGQFVSQHFGLKEHYKYYSTTGIGSFLKSPTELAYTRLREEFSFDGTPAFGIPPPEECTMDHIWARLIALGFIALLSRYLQTHLHRRAALETLFLTYIATPYKERRRLDGQTRIAFLYDTLSEFAGATDDPVLAGEVRRFLEDPDTLQSLSEVQDFNARYILDPSARETSKPDSPMAIVIGNVLKDREILTLETVSLLSESLNRFLSLVPAGEALNFKIDSVSSATQNVYIAALVQSGLFPLLRQMNEPGSRIRLSTLRYICRENSDSDIREKIKEQESIARMAREDGESEKQDWLRRQTALTMRVTRLTREADQASNRNGMARGTIESVSEMTSAMTRLTEAQEALEKGRNDHRATLAIYERNQNGAELALKRLVPSPTIFIFLDTLLELFLQSEYTETLTREANVAEVSFRVIRPCYMGSKWLRRNEDTRTLFYYNLLTILKALRIAEVNESPAERVVHSSDFSIMWHSLRTELGPAVPLPPPVIIYILAGTTAAAIPSRVPPLPVEPIVEERPPVIVPRTEVIRKSGATPKEPVRRVPTPGLIKTGDKAPRKLLPVGPPKTPVVVVPQVVRPVVVVPPPVVPKKTVPVQKWFTIEKTDFVRPKDSSKARDREGKRFEEYVLETKLEKDRTAEERRVIKEEVITLTYSDDTRLTLDGDNLAALYNLAYKTGLKGPMYLTDESLLVHFLLKRPDPPTGNPFQLAHYNRDCFTLDMRLYSDETLPIVIPLSPRPTSFKPWSNALWSALVVSGNRLYHLTTLSEGSMKEEKKREEEGKRIGLTNCLKNEIYGRAGLPDNAERIFFPYQFSGEMTGIKTGETYNWLSFYALLYMLEKLKAGLPIEQLREELEKVRGMHSDAILLMFQNMAYDMIASLNRLFTAGTLKREKRLVPGWHDTDNLSEYLAIWSPGVTPESYGRLLRMNAEWIAKWGTGFEMPCELLESALQMLSLIPNHAISLRVKTLAPSVPQGPFFFIDDRCQASCIVGDQGFYQDNGFIPSPELEVLSLAWQQKDMINDNLSAPWARGYRALLWYKQLSFGEKEARFLLEDVTRMHTETVWLVNNQIRLRRIVAILREVGDQSTGEVQVVRLIPGLVSEPNETTWQQKELVRSLLIFLETSIPERRNILRKLVEEGRSIIAELIILIERQGSTEKGWAELERQHRPQRQVQEPIVPPVPRSQPAPLLPVITEPSRRVGARPPESISRRILAVIETGTSQVSYSGDMIISVGTAYHAVFGPRNNWSEIPVDFVAFVDTLIRSSMNILAFNEKILSMVTLYNPAILRWLWHEYYYQKPEIAPIFFEQDFNGWLTTPVLHPQPPVVKVQLPEDRAGSVADSLSPLNEILTRDMEVYPEEFFSRYIIGTYLSAGSFGMIVYYKFDNHEYVAKFAKRFKEEKEYKREVPYMMRIQSAYRGGQSNALFNHIEVFDRLSSWFAPRVNLLQNKKIHNNARMNADCGKLDRAMCSDERLHVDIIVMEYVGTTLEDFLRDNSRESAINLPLIIHTLIQITGYLSALSTELRIGHNDLKLDNILVQSRVDRPDCKYLHYEYLDDRTRKALYTPFQSYICKIIDYGRTYITRPNPETPERSRVNAKFDLEILLLRYLRRVLSLLDTRGGTVSLVDYLRHSPDRQAFARLILNNIRSLNEARDDYGAEKPLEGIKGSPPYERREIKLRCWTAFEALHLFLEHVVKKETANTLMVTERVPQLRNYSLNVPDRSNVIAILILCIDELYIHMDEWVDRRSDGYSEAYVNFFAYLLNPKNELPVIKPTDVTDLNTVRMNTYSED